MQRVAFEIEYASDWLAHLRNEEFHHANFKHGITEEHVCLSQFSVALMVPNME